MTDGAAVRDRLVRILQDAHAGELAAAYAYQGHARSLRRAVERDEACRIEAAEWHHRAQIAAMLATGSAVTDVPVTQRLLGWARPPAE